MKTPYFLGAGAVLGIVDAGYLSYEHLAKITPPCPVRPILQSFIDCGKVLESPYASILGIPVAVVGLAYYLFLLFTIFKLKKYLVFITGAALLGSTYFMYIQLFVLHAICLYCTLSALLNLVIFLIVITDFIKNKNTDQSACQPTDNR